MNCLGFSLLPAGLRRITLRRTGTVLLVAMVAALLISSVACGAMLPHPISHTDIWMKLGDSSEIRISVALEDVLRFSGLTVDPLSQESQSAQTDSEPIQLKADLVAAAVRDFPTQISERLVLLDSSGNPLQLQFNSPPDWQPSAEFVSLASEGNIRLNWICSAEFSIPQSGSRSLTVWHRFDEPELTQPGELRLHLQDLVTRRRVDAAVAPRTPHTVLLPTESGEGTSTSDSGSTDTADQPSDSADPFSNSNPNDVTVSVTAMTTGTQIEVTGPLLKMRGNPGWSLSNREHAESLFRDQLTLQSWQTRIRSEIASWFAANIRITADNMPLTVLSTDTVLLNDQLEAWPAEADAATPLTNAVAGCRLRLPPVRSARTLALNFPAPTPDLSRVVVHAFTNGTAQTFVRPISTAESASDESPPPDTDEARPLRPVVRLEIGLTENTTADVPGISRTPTDTSEFRPLLLERTPLNSSGQKKALPQFVFACCIALGILGLVSGARFKGFSSVRALSGTAVLGAGCVGLIATTLTAAPAVTNPEQAELVTATLLTEMYRAVACRDEEAALDRLNSALHPELAESVFLGAVSSTLGNDGELIVRSEGVELLSASAAAPASASEDARIPLSCRWIVRCSVTHWGHVHRRAIIRTADISLQPHEGAWKIATLRETAAPQLKNL